MYQTTLVPMSPSPTSALAAHWLILCVCLRDHLTMKACIRGKEDDTSKRSSRKGFLTGPLPRKARLLKQYEWKDSRRGIHQLHSHQSQCGVRVEPLQLHLIASRSMCTAGAGSACAGSTHRRNFLVVGKEGLEELRAPTRPRGRVSAQQSDICTQRTVTYTPCQSMKSRVKPVT